MATVNLRGINALVFPSGVSSTSVTDGQTTVNLSGGGGGTPPGGSDTDVQYNDTGSFAGDSTFTFNQTTKVVSIKNLTLSTGLKDSTGALGSSGQVLSSTGTATKWITNTGAPAGSTTQVQFNNAGAFGADATLTFNATSKTLQTNNLKIVDTLLDGSNSAGTSGQVLSSTGTATAWVTPSGGGGGIYPPLTPPVSTNFTLHNPGGYTVTTTDYTTKMLTLLGTSATGLWLVQNAALPSTPYTVDFGIMAFSADSINLASIVLSNSGLTNARAFGLRVDSQAGEYGAWSVVDQSWSGPNSPGTENNIYSQDGMNASLHLVFIRVTNDGTNLNIYWSANGQNFILLQTTSVGSLGFTPASVGITFYNASGSLQMNVLSYHWLVSTSILPQNS